MICIIINNAHIAELINVIKTMISKQKQQIAAFMKTNMYMIILQFRIAVAVTKSLSVHEILTHLAREIVIRCLNMTLEDHV